MALEAKGVCQDTITECVSRKMDMIKFFGSDLVGTVA